MTVKIKQSGFYTPAYFEGALDAFGKEMTAIGEALGMTSEQIRSKFRIQQWEILVNRYKEVDTAFERLTDKIEELIEGRPQ